MRLKAFVSSGLIIAAAFRVAAAVRPEKPPQWPAGPYPARLRYSGEVRAPQSAQPQGGSAWGSWLKLILGVESAAERSAREEALLQPTGLYVRDGILYVADPGRAAVLRYNLAKKSGEWLAKPEGVELASPVGVAASRDGHLYVLDSSLERVLIFDAAGKPAGELRGDPQGMGHPAGLAVSDSRIYVSDVLNHRIMVYGLEGLYIQSFGRRGKGPGEFNFPTYLWFDPKNRQLWVTDSGNFRLQWFDPNGEPLGRFGEAGNRPGYLARPRGLARDSDGHVYVSDGAFDALQIFNTEGRLLLFAGLSGAEPGQFNLPGGVFIDEKDCVFVADTQNRRVQLFQYFKGSRP